ncbi:hypothetical protein [Shewanella zhuhaiensis]|uniref:hypothetical protein n=1 Tax=Shewanella zhuhaiensis TaxID=2919576 RepID=UPI001F0BAD4F|nr:hypothetical protein [Shewanella zhuhaiensis]
MKTKKPSIAAELFVEFGRYETRLIGPDFYQRFSQLNPKPQRAVATVVSVSNGMTTVQHADGSYQTVLGEGIASGKVYIIDGQLQGQAADLPFTEIEV